MTYSETEQKLLFSLGLPIAEIRLKTCSETGTR